MMMKRSSALLVAGVVVIATVLALVLFHSPGSATDNQRTVQTYTQSPSPTPTKSYAKLPGTWTYDCEFPVQRPLQIMLTCADGGMIITDIKWNTWAETGATGTGTYSQNMCEPSCAEGTRVDLPVSIKLSNLFKHKGRNILKTLDIQAVSGRELPNAGTKMTWDVAEFAVRMNWDVEEN